MSMQVLSLYRLILVKHQTADLNTLPRFGADRRVVENEAKEASPSAMVIGLKVTLVPTRSAEQWLWAACCHSTDGGQCRGRIHGELSDNRTKTRLDQRHLVCLHLGEVVPHVGGVVMHKISVPGAVHLSTPSTSRGHSRKDRSTMRILLTDPDTVAFPRQDPSPNQPIGYHIDLGASREQAPGEVSRR